MSLKKASLSRAFSLAELLTVVVIFGLVASLAAAVIGPVLNAPNAHRAKGDTVQAGTQALYQLQRDVRQANVSGVFVCTNTSPAVCAPPTPTVAAPKTDTPVLSLVTPRVGGNGTLQWDVNNGQTAWTGFNVYWLVPNSEGSNDLMYAFASANLAPGALTFGYATASDATTTAMQSPSARIIAHNVSSIQTSVDETGRQVGLTLLSQATVNGHLNQTSFTSDTVPRN